MTVYKRNPLTFVSALAVIMASSLTSLNSLSSNTPSQQTPDGTPQFIHLDHKLCCLLCKDVVRNAVQTMCGHRMCLSCVEVYLGSKNGRPLRCPAGEDTCCELRIEEIYRDSSARREVRLLLVYCTFRNESNGCQETMPWKDLQKHEEICVYRKIKCPNRASGCGEEVAFKDLSHHENSCFFRPIKCRFCDAVMIASEQENHEKTTCRRVIIPCLYKCGIPPTVREEINQHMIVCENRPKECKFKSVGCDFTGIPQDVKAHEEQSVDKHLELVTIYTSNVDLQSLDMRQDMQTMSTNQDITNQAVAEIKTQISTMMNSIGQMKDSVKDLKRKIVAQTERVINVERKMENSAKMEMFEKSNRDLLALQTKQTEQGDRINVLERLGPSGGENAIRKILETTDNMRSQLQQHDRQLGIQDIRMAELDLRFQVLETASYDGVLMWKIRDYLRRKQDATNGTTLSLYSQPFYTGRFGYKMCARLYLNGDGMGKGTHLSLFFVIMRGEYDPLLQWPFQQKVTLMLLDQDTGRRNLSDTFCPDPSSGSFKRPTSDMNIASGCPLFVSHAVLETRTYLRDDSLFLKVMVDTQGINQ